MGELAGFEDIRIKMYSLDTQKHKKPHFHLILTDGNKAFISISNGKILEGRLNKRQKDYVKAWMLIHKEGLWDILQGEKFGANTINGNVRIQSILFCCFCATGNLENCTIKNLSKF